MKIAMVACPAWAVWAPNPALLLLSAQLERDGHHTELFDLNIEAYHDLPGCQELWLDANSIQWETKEVLERLFHEHRQVFAGYGERIARSVPDIVCFTVNSGARYSFPLFARMLRERLPDALFVASGSDCSRSEYFDQHMIPGVIDALCIREGDPCLTELVNRIRQTGAISKDQPGFLFWEDDNIRDNGDPPGPAGFNSPATVSLAATANDSEQQQLKEVARKLGDILPSLEKLVNSLKKTTFPADILMPVGEICLKLGMSSTAQALFQQALAVDPINSDALVNLGVILMQAGKYRKAESFFFKAFEASLDKTVWHAQAKENLLTLYRHYPQILDIPLSLNKYCPCCEQKFPRFLPFGIPPLLNALCPQCNSLARHRLLWMYLKERTNILRDNLQLLHFAPEGFLQEVLSRLPNISYLSADLFLPSAMVKMDITDITLEDKSVDVIICIHVLEHIVDDHKAMTELYRVLRPGGWALLQSPLDLDRDKTFEDPNIVSPEERYRHFGQADHVRWYGLDYKDRLEKAGFVVNVDGFVRELSDEVIQRFGLDRREDIYFCSKPC